MSCQVEVIVKRDSGEACYSTGKILNGEFNTASDLDSRGKILNWNGSARGTMQLSLPSPVENFIERCFVIV